MEHHAFPARPESRYRRVFEAAVDGLLILDAATGRIEDANPTLTQILGHSLEQLLGKELWEIGIFPDRERSNLALEQLRQQRVLRYENVPLQTREGMRRDVEFVGSLYEADGRDVVQCNVRDVSARRQLERQLEEHAKEVEASDRLKSDFLAILSHELRSPLAAIRYALPQIEKSPLDAAGRRALAVITRQLTQLVRLVDDLLDLTRVTSGKIALKPQQVALETVVNTAVESVTPVMDAARHDFRVTLPAEPLVVHGDPDRLSQVISNILRNAAKYTPRGGRISLEAGRENDQAFLRVTDNGIGIAAGQLPRLFEMFTQAHPTEQSQGGLGVGLTIAKQLVELHGGSIEARSEGPGFGAEFVVRLPMVQRPLPTAAEPRVARSGRATRRLKVLIVEDNYDLVQMLELAVQGMGHEVRKALDGQSAITAALSYRPDVVLLDLGLPVVSGLDVARELRQHEAVAHAWLVALTGWGQEEDRRQTMDAGFDHHLTKPTDPEELENLLAGIAAQRPRGSPNPST